jgi:hypothetical protein
VLGACLAAAATMVLAFNEPWARGGPWWHAGRKRASDDGGDAGGARRGSGGGGGGGGTGDEEEAAALLTPAGPGGSVRAPWSPASEGQQHCIELGVRDK